LPHFYADYEVGAGISSCNPQISIFHFHGSFQVEIINTQWLFPRDLCIKESQRFKKYNI